MISLQHFLTAAHCVILYNQSAPEYEGLNVLGRTVLLEDKRICSPVLDMHIHDHYKIDNTGFAINDIAVVTVSTYWLFV